MDQLERLGGADTHTRLLSIGPALLAPVGGIDTQVALGGFVLERIPDRPMRPLRTGLNTHLAAVAFPLVDYPDITVRGVHMGRSGGTILDAEGRDALAAHSHIDV